MEINYLIEAIGWLLLKGLFVFGIYFLLDHFLLSRWNLWKRWIESSIQKKIKKILIFEGILLVLLFIILIDFLQGPGFDKAPGFFFLMLYFVEINEYVALFLLAPIIYKKIKKLTEHKSKKIVLIILTISLIFIAQNLNFKNIKILKCQMEHMVTKAIYRPPATRILFPITHKMLFSNMYALFSDFSYSDADQYCYNKIANENIAYDDKTALKTSNANLCKSDFCYREIAKKNLDSTLCEKISDDQNKNDCYKYIAIEKNDASLCAKIERSGSKEWEETDRNGCYKTIAINILDLELCDKIIGKILFTDKEGNPLRDGTMRNDCRMEILRKKGEI